MLLLLVALVSFPQQHVVALPFLLKCAMIWGLLFDSQAPFSALSLFWKIRIKITRTFLLLFLISSPSATSHMLNQAFRVLLVVYALVHSIGTHIAEQVTGRIIHHPIGRCINNCHLHLSKPCSVPLQIEAIGCLVEAWFMSFPWLCSWFLKRYWTIHICQPFGHTSSSNGWARFVSTNQLVEVLICLSSFIALLLYG